MTATSAADRARLRDAYHGIRDLFAPDPRRYWADLVGTGIIGWASAAVAVGAAGRPEVAAVAVAIAIPVWYRASLMVHELTHQKPGEIPGFHLAWNLVIGVAWLFPSIMYERVHNGHHRRTTYGTPDDPEYLPLAGRPWAIAGYLAVGLVLFPLLFLRFLIVTPLSYVIPPLRRFLFRYGSSYVINPWFARSMNRQERQRILCWELIILAVWVPPVVLTLTGVLPWRWLAVWYVIHTGATMINKVRMLAAHHFASDGHPTDHFGQFRDSVDTPGGWWTELWAPLGLRYHALHHLFPTLPFHNMGKAYARLTAGSPDGALYPAGTGRGFLGTMKELLSADPTPQVGIPFRQN
jgi:fatty acid desaturase